MREWYELHKQCKCGSTMNIKLRTVIYKNKIEIENVPVFSCEDCRRSEVLAEVKSELTGVIGKLEQTTNKQHIHFNDISEIAHLMFKVTEKQYATDPVEKIVEERINELLDLLLLAQSLQDEPWVEDVRKRLEQISKQSLSLNDSP
ncbi:YgiT-type zinc finger protein [Paenibacillus sp. FSL H8-0034]|uniref:YgiT-type zinc finger protein n=1 Tax=Paenibacillus sp. FSL H8-0034 TaxID=2954671 RepID=UPI0030FC1EA3